MLLSALADRGWKATAERLLDSLLNVDDEQCVPLTSLAAAPPVFRHLLSEKSVGLVNVRFVSDALHTHTDMQGAAGGRRKRGGTREAGKQRAWEGGRGTR